MSIVYAVQGIESWKDACQQITVNLTARSFYLSLTSLTFYKWVFWLFILLFGWERNKIIKTAGCIVEMRIRTTDKGKDKTVSGKTSTVETLLWDKMTVIQYLPFRKSLSPKQYLENNGYRREHRIGYERA